MDAFRQRVTTAVFFGIIVIGAILLHPYTCVGLLALITAWTSLEYANTVLPKRKYLIVILALGIFALALITAKAFVLTVLLWGCILTGTMLSVYVFLREKNLNHQVFAFWNAAFYLGAAMGLFAREMLGYQDYRYFFMGILILIWLSDSGAYIVGSQWGKRKLMPKVSPNKTVEGFLGSLVAALIGGYFLSKLTPIKTTDWWIIISLVVWLIGSLGDLVQSSVKRQYGVKDTGTILPGHGGMWDRFDSLILAAPVILLLDKYLL